MKDNEKKTRDNLDKEMVIEALNHLKMRMEYRAEAASFADELKEYDEEPAFICYRLYTLLRMITAYCAQLAVNSLAEGDEKAAKRLMAVSNMTGAYSPIELFEDFGPQEVKFTSSGKTRDSIILSDIQSGAVVYGGKLLPEGDEEPENMIEKLFGPLKKKDEDPEDEEDETDEENEE